MKRGGHIYIITNKHHTTLYTGVTSRLAHRIYEHKTKKYKNSFSARYNLYKLVYYEAFNDIRDAISREKQIKDYSRAKKVKLIEDFNAAWKDLMEDLN